MRTNPHTNEAPGSTQRGLDAFQSFQSLAWRACLWGNCEGECRSALTSVFYNTLSFMISTSFAALPAPASNCTSHSSAGLSRFRSQARSLLAAGDASSPNKLFPRLPAEQRDRAPCFSSWLCCCLAPVASGSFPINPLVPTTQWALSSVSWAGCWKGIWEGNWDSQLELHSGCFLVAGSSSEMPKGRDEREKQDATLNKMFLKHFSSFKN